MAYDGVDESKRWPLSRFLIVGVVIAVAGYLPLQCYIIFGPRDGNPIGLGLLAVIGILLGMIVFSIGVIKRVIRYFLA
ncbi:hypothetical protein ACO0LB_03975 [Undibacterium sp. SXout7W]|uniref:hypothetical protein n=1 Tax=Undibacterium sp. SXout7W TaxID=3413049 RepID=UPI003BEFE708